MVCYHTVSARTEMRGETGTMRTFTSLISFLLAFCFCSLRVNAATRTNVVYWFPYDFYWGGNDVLQDQIEYAADWDLHYSPYGFTAEDYDHVEGPRYLLDLLQSNQPVQGLFLDTHSYDNTAGFMASAYSFDYNGEQQLEADWQALAEDTTYCLKWQSGQNFPAIFILSQGIQPLIGRSLAQQAIITNIACSSALYPGAWGATTDSARALVGATVEEDIPPDIKEQIVDNLTCFNPSLSCISGNATFAVPEQYHFVVAGNHATWLNPQYDCQSVQRTIGCDRQGSSRLGAMAGRRWRFQGSLHAEVVRPGRSGAGYRGCDHFARG